MGRFVGKVAFVTGAGRGQGRSHAEYLASEGADIIALDICGSVGSISYQMASEDDLAETARLVEKHDRRVFTAVADVRDPIALKEAVQEGVSHLGRLDVVSANAGICGYGRVEELSEDEWNDTIDTNLSGVWRTVKVSVPHLIESGGGAIVLTSSTAGMRGYANIAHYTAAKHGIIGLAKTMAVELAEKNIRVNTVVPTSVNTPLIHNSAAYRVFAPDIDDPQTADVEDAFANLNAMPGVPWIEPIDVSKAVAFLASDDARYITGAVLPVDAGQTAQ